MLQVERKYVPADLLKKYFIGNHQTLFFVCGYVYSIG